MELRSQSDADALIDRFTGFFDAVVVEIRLRLPQQSALRTADVTLLAREDGPSEPGPWRRVTITVHGLADYQLSEGRVSYLVLSEGLRLHGIGGDRCTVDLSPGLRPTDPREAASAQFLSGAWCEYKVEDAD